jgi:hypothetical protein
MQGKCASPSSYLRRFAARGSLFAAPEGATLSRGAQIARVTTNTGFFRVCFARAPNYASFEAWKSSFAKLAGSRVELWSDVYCDRHGRGPSS